MRGWDASCDPGLEFESEVLRAALAAWHDRAGDAVAPSRRAMTARVLKPFIGHVTVFERIGEDPSCYRIRLMGTRMTAVLGEMQGKTVEEALSHRAGRHWRMALDATLNGKCPLRFTTRVGFRNLDYLTAEALLAPLLDDAGRLTMVFAAVTFAAGVETTRQRAATL